MVLKSIVSDGIQRRVETRPGGLFYLHRRWAPAADLVAIALTSLVSYQLAHHLLSGRQDLGGWYVATDIGIAVIWFAALSLHTVGPGKALRAVLQQWQTVFSVTFQLFTIVLLTYLISRIELLDMRHLVIEIPLGLLGILLARYVLRRFWGSEGKTSVLLAGDDDAVREMVAVFSRHRGSGFEVVGVCTPGADRWLGEPAIEVGDHRVPVVGDDRHVVEAAQRTSAQIVAVAMTDNLGRKELSRLASELGDLGIELAVSPGDVDETAVTTADRGLERVHMLEMLAPGYRRARSMSKEAFDMAFAAAAIMATAPVMIAIATAIKLTSTGPVFYVSERIGLDGMPFRMIKFRSMYTGADRDTAAMIDSAGSTPVFFKAKEDPRVTPVGAFIRKYSLDELPQFFNVLFGDMSVVGPRPQVQREVDAYDETMRRRLLVKPGVTGQWQVSGRNDLSVDESIRHDISYVDNWSMGLDIRIISRTVGAVVRSEGAY
ncbi:sugar transferase [Mycobacteroides salmoniphilum]|uniref:sugar transferase n=1 Tax=Mycobacteroides salmoniphilum TaxID=404941 RepID=UPI000992076D|nr:sugar transferase [Mycobacteroides salmoniphilum]QCH22621.1 UDP-glucose:undecaprenyl-phosphate glucose-1-phosphate transferase [Mycobacteroides salmoniphilum]